MTDSFRTSDVNSLLGIVGGSLSSMAAEEHSNLGATLEVLQHSIPLDHAVLLKRTANAMTVGPSLGLDPQLRSMLELDASNLLVEQAVQDRANLFIRDLERDGRISDADLLVPARSVRSVCCQLIKRDDEILGALWVATRRDSPPLAEAEVRLVDTIARLVADFLMRTRQYGEMQRLATMDELTGLMNRMQMLPLIGQEVERSSRYNVPLSVVMLDLDLFKRINDTFGHMIGDRVLAGFAQILKNGSRRVDYVFRYGGEEFLALLPHTPPDNAKIYAERIRRTVRDSLHVSANLESPITISAGISSLPGSGKSVEDLVGAADAALYRAKQEGRDRVCLG